MSSATPWQAVLSGADAERSSVIIDEIAAALSADVPPRPIHNAAALTDGLPGWALFFASLDRAAPHRGQRATAARLLDAAVDDGDTVSGSQALFEGVTGLAWVIQHLAWVARDEHVAALEEIDAAMFAALEPEPFATDFDLMSGLVGLGVLALERAPSPVARGVLERIATWLDATAERTPEGLSWRTRPASLHPAARATFPAGCHYPGVAHGTAGVVGLLASMLTEDIAPATTRRLLEGAVEWLLTQEMPGNHALFPFQLDTVGARAASRSAWCTGGPGISVMVWRAGQAAGEPTWLTRAVALARAAASRPLAEMGVRDACLCHGTAGLGLIHARWFNATGDAFFADESSRWFRRTLDYQRAGEGVAGYSVTNAPKGTLDSAPGLLFGAAGVGLALLAATTAIEPAWDRVFLMSGPTPAARRGA